MIERRTISNVSGHRVSETHRDENEWPRSEPVGKSPTARIKGPANVERVFLEYLIHEVGKTMRAATPTKHRWLVVENICISIYDTDALFTSSIY